LNTGTVLQHSPRPPAGFQGAVSWQGRGGKRREKEEEGAFPTFS